VAGKAPKKEAVARIGADGLPLPGHSIENKHVDPVAIPGAFFE
jgi:hypothetical protein